MGLKIPVGNVERFLNICTIELLQYAICYISSSFTTEFKSYSVTVQLYEAYFIIDAIVIHIYI